jgi:hypothetical protein
MAYEPSEKAIEAAREAFGLLSNRAQMRAALIAAHEAEHPPHFGTVRSRGRGRDALHDGKAGYWDLIERQPAPPLD